MMLDSFSDFTGDFLNVVLILVKLELLKDFFNVELVLKCVKQLLSALGVASVTKERLTETINVSLPSVAVFIVNSFERALPVLSDDALFSLVIALERGKVGCTMLVEARLVQDLVELVPRLVLDVVVEAVQDLHDVVVAVLEAVVLLLAYREREFVRLDVK